MAKLAFLSIFQFLQHRARNYSLRCASDVFNFNNSTACMSSVLRGPKLIPEKFFMGHRDIHRKIGGNLRTTLFHIWLILPDILIICLSQAMSS